MGQEFWSRIDLNWNNWRVVQAEAQGGGEGSETAAGAMDSGDWRTQLLPDLRQRIDNMIMETLKRHVSVSGQERVQELKEIAVTFEEKIYSTATSQMLIVETRRSQNLIQPNPASSGQNALGRGSHNMQSQVNSQALPVPMVANQTQTRQPLLQQNLQNNMAPTGLQNCASLAPALPSEQNLPAVDESKNVANVSSLKPLASESKGFAFWVELVAPGLSSAGYLSYVVCELLHRSGDFTLCAPKGQRLRISLVIKK
ncbi:hypothetical protein KY290_023319 [Solanum tuberosum]|uniref:Mediator complex subunit 15 KIX domain-containing protein n=1 Tax=Solanum tuberosum TaxID=4113 RepID=A0ABQ7V733_SOLTU|nr:hypothetical protein KY290_023319 [Solanum tuberosum]